MGDCQGKARHRQTKPYRVTVSPQAAKQLERLPPHEAARIAKRIEALGGNPRPSGCESLAGIDACRIRIGVHRVIYQIRDRELLVLVLRVRHRKDVYRGL